MRLGILGGAFDPIHNAHLFIAECARVSLKLDRILFVPTGLAHHKPSRRLSPAEDRFRMVELAVAGNPAFEASRLEIDRPGPSYTIDTLSELQSANPMAELYFLLGLDALRDLGTWKQPEEVLKMATFVAIPRPGFDAGSIGGVIPRGAEKRIVTLDAPELAISSSMIRDRVTNGLPIRYLLPDSVEGYIRERLLYR